LQKANLRVRYTPHSGHKGFYQVQATSVNGSKVS